jgi:predicted nucleic acid-binding protein
MVNYFFDTYAIIELLEHNPNFKKYGEYPMITTTLNKIEVYWWALTKHDKALADILLRSLCTQDISDEVISEAMVFRQKFKKRDISYADAIGYVFARKNDVLFLTGDRQFKDLPGVEFVQ